MRENARVLGNLQSDFDFRQRPRRPLLLPTLPPSALQPSQLPGPSLMTWLTQLGP